VLKRLVALVAVSLPLICVHDARGQGAGTSAAGDSTEVAPIANIIFKPTFELTSKGNVTSNDMMGRFSSSLFGFQGWSLVSNLSASQTNYRSRDRREESKLFNNSLGRMIRPGLSIAIGQSSSRVFNRAALVTGGFQDFILNNDALTGTVTATSTGSGPLGWDGRVLGTITDGQYTFKNDTGQGGQTNGGVRYRFWDGGRVQVQLRGSYRDVSEKSTSVYRTFDGLSTTEDSLSSTVDIALTDSLSIGVDWMDYSYERVFADQSRGAGGAQNVGAENLFKETERRENRNLGFNVNTSPIKGFNLVMGASHSEQLNDFANTPTRYSRTVEDRVASDVAYQMKSGMKATIKLENSETLRDLGPQSRSSYTDVRKRLSLGLSKAFSQTFRVDVNAAQALTQSFYVDFAATPRDRDLLDSSIRANIASAPFPKISTALSLSVTSSKFVNTHYSQSENNRTKDRYDFRPTIRYKMNDRVSVEQSYGLAIEVTDFHFKPEENFLDRNITFSNRITHNVTDHLKTDFTYSLTLHDRGSYLPLIVDGVQVGSEEYLDIEREDRTDQTRLSFEWKVSDHVSLVGRHDYSRRRDKTIATGSTNTTTDGGIEGGATGSYDWGAGRQLSFEFKRAERFSPFGTEEQKKYWIANLSFKYAF